MHPVTHENVGSCITILSWTSTWTWTWTLTVRARDQVQVEVHDHVQDQAWQNRNLMKEG